MINISRPSRNALSRANKEFLAKAIPWSGTISKWVGEKALLLKLPVQYQMYPCVALADILIESNWGTHPLSLESYERKYSNNLTLLKVDSQWDGKSHQWEGNSYKAFKDWVHFCANYSDVVIYSNILAEILQAPSIEDQIDVLSKTKAEPLAFAVKAKTIIDLYHLSDYNKTY